MRDLPLFRGALPTKLFEALAASRPVVLSAAGESAEFVERHGVGLVVAPEDPSALADAFAELHSAPDERFTALSGAARACAERYDRSQATERWLGILRGLA